MAPERFRGVTDRRGDIYSLGATLYELLTLRPAFAERDQARLIDQIAHEPPAPLRQHDRRIPRDLETLVLKALAKDPEDRFATAGELGDELRRFLESRPIRSRPIAARERLWRWCKRNPWLAGGQHRRGRLLTTLLAHRLDHRGLDLSHQRDQIAAIQTRAERDARKPVRVARRPRRRPGGSAGGSGQRFESLDALAQAAAIAPGAETATRPLRPAPR